MKLFKLNYKLHINGGFVSTHMFIEADSADEAHAILESVLIAAGVDFSITRDVLLMIQKLKCISFMMI